MYLPVMIPGVVFLFLYFYLLIVLDPVENLKAECLTIPPQPRSAHVYIDLKINLEMNGVNSSKPFASATYLHSVFPALHFLVLLPLKVSLVQVPVC